MTETTLRRLTSALRSTEQPRQVALVLLAHVLKKPKTWVLAHPEAVLSPEQNSQIERLFQRLEAGEPLPYLTGTQAFFGLDFVVTHHTLIPRPETELLVEEALNWLDHHPEVKNALDVGTGSGCIAVTIASRKPNLTVSGTDISAEALKIAQLNAAAHRVEAQITFSQADLLPEGAGKFDLVCANLPYIPTAKLTEVNTLGFEPNLALDGGPDGLGLILRLLNSLPSRLSEPGLALLETESTLGEETLTLAKAAFPLADVQLRQDLAGRDRLIRIEVK